MDACSSPDADRGFGAVTVLHLVAGWRERRQRSPARARRRMAGSQSGAPDYIPDKAARIIAAPGGERIAVFRDGARSAR